MEIKRDIVRQLLLWKDAPGRKPLVVTGVRQCGKTYVLQQFGKQHFSSSVYINFERNRQLHEVFSRDYNPQRILREVELLLGLPVIVPGRDLVIFDEVQACPPAITALKYFCEELPELHVVAAGSLLGVTINHIGFSFPVGKVERLQMFPLSFHEFCVARGEENALSHIKGMALENPLPEWIADRMRGLLKEYYCVGGMPEAVVQWVETGSMEAVELVQERILNDYTADFAKHAPASDIPKLGWIWESVPRQLARDNQKFVFSHVREGKRAADLEDALQWLVSAGLIYKLCIAEQVALPLAFHVNPTYFKVMLCDTGLLCRMAGLTAGAVVQESRLYATFKGALMENFVMLELIKANHKPAFWRSGNSAELDFLLESKERIVPIEAKAEVNTKAKTYVGFCKKYQPPVGFRVSMRNVGVNLIEGTRSYSLPLYALWRLDDYLSDGVPN